MNIRLLAGGCRSMGSQEKSSGYEDELRSLEVVEAIQEKSDIRYRMLAIKATE